MARLPTRDDLGPIPNVRPSGPIGRIPGGYNVGEAIAEFGREMSRVGLKLSSGWSKVRKTGHRGAYLKFKADEERRHLEEPQDEEGATDRTSGGYKERASKLMTSMRDASPQERADYEQRLFSLEARLTRSSAAQEIAGQKKVGLAAINAGIEEGVFPRIEVAAKQPRDVRRALLQDSDRDAREFIEDAVSLLPEEEQEVARADIERGYEQNRAAKVMSINPRLFADDRAAGAYMRLPMDEIAAIEATAFDRILDEDRAADDLIRFGDPDLGTEALRSIAAGDFSPEWGAANRRRLPPGMRKVVDRAMSPPSADRTSSRAELELLDAAYSDPDKGAALAADAFADGAVSRDVFSRAYDAANTAADLSPHLRRARQRVSESNRPSSGDSDLDFGRHLDWVSTFDQWAAAHPGASPKDVDAAATELIAAEKRSIAVDKAGRLPMPRFSRAADRSLVTLPDLETAKGETIAALQSGSMTPDEAADAALVLRQWYGAIGEEKV